MKSPGRLLRCCGAAGLLLLAACQALVPEVVRPEITHVSHISQHFGSDRTNYGYDALDVMARWRKGPWVIEASEGVVIEERWNEGPLYGYGAMIGPREIFTAHVGYEFRLK